MAAHYWILFVFAFVAMVAVVADIIAAAKNVKLTFSWITAEWALRHTISVFVIGWALGLLCGHLFWFQIPVP
jgi:uncharacterized membrane protein YciS (DUF1049 family)